MKTQFDAINIVYQVINASTLKGAINGTLNKLKRPTGSDKEDIVINSITMGDTNFQEGVLNVNIYVPNISAVKSSLPNTARLAVLSSLAHTALEEVSGDNYSFWISTQAIFEEKDINYHFVNVRLEFRFLG
jgi:hypothetical protein